MTHTRFELKAVTSRAFCVGHLLARCLQSPCLGTLTGASSLTGRACLTTRWGCTLICTNYTNGSRDCKDYFQMTCTRIRVEETLPLFATTPQKRTISLSNSETVWFVNKKIFLSDLKVEFLSSHEQNGIRTASVAAWSNALLSCWSRLPKTGRSGKGIQKKTSLHLERILTPDRLPYDLQADETDAFVSVLTVASTI
uniref:Uncharacterized protein n=1 Tax=Timema tahoe TaxID=61484 RepID=A0A7R9NWA4_9NEOP|nr:unnamed protein product [Timema tahoe]